VNSKEESLSHGGEPRIGHHHNERRGEKEDKRTREEEEC